MIQGCCLQGRSQSVRKMSTRPGLTHGIPSRDFSTKSGARHSPPESFHLKQMPMLGAQLTPGSAGRLRAAAVCVSEPPQAWSPTTGDQRNRPVRVLLEDETMTVALDTATGKVERFDVRPLCSEELGCLDLSPPPEAGGITGQEQYGRPRESRDPRGSVTQPRLLLAPIVSRLVGETGPEVSPRLSSLPRSRRTVGPWARRRRCQRRSRTGGSAPANRLALPLKWVMSAARPVMSSSSTSRRASRSWLNSRSEKRNDCPATSCSSSRLPGARPHGHWTCFSSASCGAKRKEAVSEDIDGCDLPNSSSS